MENIGVLIAVVAGLLSFLSPCVIPLVPVYLANIAGAAANGGEARASFLHALIFVSGFSLIFIALGAAMGALGSLFATYNELLRKVAGGLLFLFGLTLLMTGRIPLLSRQLVPGNIALGRFVYLRSLLMGAAFALGWTPCVGPVLGGILTMALGSQTVWQGIYLLAAYSLGLAVPFLIMGAGFAPFTRLIRRLNQHLGLVSIISGVLLMAVGILMFTNTLVRLNSLYNLGF